MLLEFKESNDLFPPSDLLTQLLDNTTSINFRTLYFVLYSEKNMPSEITQEEAEETGIKKLEANTKVFLMNKQMIANNSCILRVTCGEKVFYMTEEEFRKIRIKTLVKRVEQEFYLMKTVIDDKEVDVIYSKYWKKGDKREYCPVDFGPKQKHTLNLEEKKEHVEINDGKIDHTHTALGIYYGKTDKTKNEAQVKVILKKSIEDIKQQEKDEKQRQKEQKQKEKEDRLKVKEDEKQKRIAEKQKEKEDREKEKERLKQEREKERVKAKEEKERLKQEKAEERERKKEERKRRKSEKTSQHEPNTSILEKYIHRDKIEMGNDAKRMKKSDEQVKEGKTLFDFMSQKNNTVRKEIVQKAIASTQIQFIPGPTDFTVHKTTQRMRDDLHAPKRYQIINIRNYVDTYELSENIKYRYVIKTNKEDNNVKDNINNNTKNKWHVFSNERIENVLDYDINSEVYSTDGESVHTDEKDSDTDINERELDKELMAEDSKEEDKDIFVKNTQKPRFLSDIVKIYEYEHES